jgi:hypothetical protein
MTMQNNNAILQTVETWVSRIAFVILGLLYTDMKDDISRQDQRLFAMQAERFTPGDAQAMENRLSKMVEASIADNRNNLATLRSDINGKFDNILLVLSKDKK